MNGTVRLATPDAAPIVREVARESWHAAYNEFLGAERVANAISDWYAIDGLEASITEAADREDATFLLAERRDDAKRENDDVVGFVHAGADADDPDVANLIRLYVRPTAWGDGVGTALLERVESDLRNACDRLRLVVLADNEIGVSFYESSGFERVESRDSDLGNGLEEYVYEKSL
ncbi:MULTISPECIES: GNAT family N-acetyltransferase [Natrialbaceae]|uniref:GNAT family N-acetyltransferase n=1 Tax=Natrialbaceae TaxID=1644061 RepID=UPI00207C2701|nr:GNAT family N-acetyltransferase [Natronococcus sp. CG52]